MAFRDTLASETHPMTPDHDPAPSGLPHAIGAYLLWGLLPLYLMLLRHVPPIELVGWRVVFTLPVCLLAVLASRQVAQLGAALANRKVLVLLAASACMIAINWAVYFMAITGGHVFAASLGYYINPLANVLAGTLFLGERLSRPQWLAVALAGLGVSLLAWGARDMLGISLALAGTFATYGLLRKFVSASSLSGLTIEAAFLLLPALAVVAWYARTPGGISMGDDPRTSVLIALSGIVTAVPLLLFATAARRMDYSALGFVQFLSPTLAFVLGLLVFREPLRPIQLACFIVIWTAIAVFIWDMWRRRSR